ncbi:TPA: polysaccharide biosynthesis C-terminal domain-containing protein [Photobacterium damselae]
MVKKNIILSLSGQSLRIIFNATFLMMLVKILPIDKFGIYSLICAISLLISPYSNLGTHILLVKNANCKLSTDKERLIKSQEITLVIGSILALISYLIYFVFFSSVLSVSLLLLFFCEIVTIRMYDNLVYHYQAKEKFDFTLYIKSLIPLCKILSILPLVIFGLNFNDWGYIYFFSMNIPIFMYFIICLFKVKVVNKNIFDLKAGFYISSSLLIYGVFSATDQIMIGYFINDEMVAIYAFAAKIYLMLILPVQAITSVYLKELFVEKDINKKNDIFIKAKVLIVIYSIVVMLFLFMFTKLIIDSYFKEYIDSVFIIMVLTFAFPLKALSSLMSDFILSLNQSKQRFNCEIKACLVNIMLNVILIPIWGIKGAAISTLISEIFLFYCFYKLKKVYVNYA